MNKKIYHCCLLLMLSTLVYSQESNLSIQPDIVYGHKFGMALTFDVFIPSNRTGAAVVFLNSGGFVSGKVRFLTMNVNLECSYLKKEELMIIPENFKYPPLAQFSMDELLEYGITVFDVRHGSSPKFTLDEIVEDCHMAVQFIKNHAGLFKIDPDRIGLFGASAGGYLAAYLATTGAGIKTVAIFYPAGYDFIELKNTSAEAYESLPALHLDEEILDDLSLKRHISADDPSFLIIYGEDDFPFITGSCTAIAAGLTEAKVENELIPIPGIGHEFRNNEGYHAEHGEFARLKMAQWFNGKLNND
jgi:dienelactone hydrolase